MDLLFGSVLELDIAWSSLALKDDSGFSELECLGYFSSS